VIQSGSFDFNLGLSVVPMQIPALPVVVQQAVPVAEVDLFGNFVNGGFSSKSGCGMLTLPE
jgi:hypothetical protein